MVLGIVLLTLAKNATVLARCGVRHAEEVAKQDFEIRHICRRHNATGVI